MNTSSRPSFSAQQQAWYEQACARIDPKRLQKLLFEIVDIHSPTGAARAASEFMARHLAQVGMDARYLLFAAFTTAPSCNVRST